MELVPLVRWLFLITALYATALPLGAALWPSLPDRGAAFALPLAVVVAGLGAFWVGQVAYGPGVALATTAIPVLAGLALYRRGYRPDVGRAAGTYGTFLLAFGALLYLRTTAPTITGSADEQFLHYGVLNAVERASAFPPEDMWFAGESVRYYYGGHVTTVTLATVAGVELRYAYNLALATYFGVLVTAAYGLAGAVAARGGTSRRLGGVLGAFLAGFAGTLTTPVRLGFGLLPGGLAVDYAEPVFGAIRFAPPEEMLARQSDPETWSWVFERNVVYGTLHETGLYTFVKPDHHGHTITAGFLLLAAALAYAYYLAPAEERRRRLVLLFGTLPLVGGWLGVTNTWALPSVPGLAWLALSAAPGHPASLLPVRVVDAGRRRLTTGVLTPTVRNELGRVGLATVFTVGVGVLSGVFAAPFVLAGMPTSEGVGVFPPRTSLVGFLLLFGGPSVLFAVYLGTRRLDPPATSAPVVLGGGAVAALAAGYLAGPDDIAVLVVCGVFLAGGYVVARSSDDAGFEAVLLLAGVGLVLSMELVYADVWPAGSTAVGTADNPRWITTMKISIQAWTFSAVAAGVVAARLLDRGRTRLRATPLSDRLGGAGLVAVVVGVLLASAGFPVMVGVQELPGAQGSFDGMAGHEEWQGDQLSATEWLDEREGTPVLLEAPTRESYTGGSIASTFTGLPSVVGWDHQRGYRGNEAFERRADHADQMYAADRQRVLALLRQYEVEYVWVGPVERERYEVVNEFDDVEGIEVAFENDAVTIYRVDRGALGTGRYTDRASETGVCSDRVPRVRAERPGTLPRPTNSFCPRAYNAILP